jgi:cobalt-zinc-cadmium efflux system outer membrane protein
MMGNRSAGTRSTWADTSHLDETRPSNIAPPVAANSPWSEATTPAPAPVLASNQATIPPSTGYPPVPSQNKISPPPPYPHIPSQNNVTTPPDGVRLVQAEEDLPPPVDEIERTKGPSITERLKLPKELPGSEAPRIPKLPQERGPRQALVDRIFPDLLPVWELGPTESRPEKLGDPGYELTENDKLWELGLSELQPGQRPATLDELQQVAAVYSPLIVQARADIISFRGTAIQAGTHPNPIVGYESDTVGSSQNRDYQGVYVSQIIKTMNKLGLQRLVAEMDHLNSQLALQKTRIAVSSQVKADYYAVLVAQQNVTISAALVRFTEQVLKLQTQKLVDSGLSVPYEAAQLRTLVQAARAALVTAQNDYVGAWKKLAATVGVPDLRPSQLAGEADAPPPVINYQEALARMWSVHPDVLAGRNLIAQARYQLRLDRIKPIPDVYAYITVQKDYTTPGVNHVAYNSQVGVPLPLFDRNRGAIINAEGDLMRAEQQVRRMQYDLQRQLADVFANYETNRSNVRRFRDSMLPDAAQTYRGVYARYIQRPDLLQVTDIVVAQQQLATYIASYIGYLNGQWQSVADLANLLQVDRIEDLNDLRNAPVGTTDDRRQDAKKGGH